MHSNLLIVGILTVGFTLASFFAYVMQCFRLPSILGYLLAGYIIGPYSPGFVADVAISEQLAEIGVILMLFGVGLHFKIEDLIRVKNIAIPGAIGQTLVATVFATLVVYWIGWPIETGLIIGLSIGVSSTVVLVRILSDNNLLNTQKGHIAVGWLVVEDIFTVIILILLPTFVAFSTDVNFSFVSITNSVLFIFVKFLILALFMFTWGHRIISYILTNIARSSSNELFTLTILALVFLVAMGSSVVFGTSIALGAFIAGMVIGKTNVRHQVAANALPLKDIFVVIFFLSVGMLFNPMAIATHFTLFLGILGVILIIKPIVAYLITLFLGYPLNIALTVAISLAQIGEFSFILAEEAMHLNLIPDEGFDILVACALVSISLNPLLFEMIGFFESMLKSLCRLKKSSSLEIGNEKEVNPAVVVVVGYGAIGKEISRILNEYDYVPLIIEQNNDMSVYDEEHTVYFGDATEINTLKDVQIEKASHLLITITDTAKIVKIIYAARQVNPHIQILALAQYESEKTLMEALNVKYICAENAIIDAYISLARQLFKPEISVS